PVFRTPEDRKQKTRKPTHDEMGSPPKMSDAPSSTDLRFPSTCWSRIEQDTTAALETLAQRYWRPIHAYLRRALSRNDADARDLTQDFFVWMIETSFVHKADPARGRFRAFLKTALRRYVDDQDQRARALKRGGGRRFVPLAGDDPTATAYEPP